MRNRFLEYARRHPIKTVVISLAIVTLLAFSPLIYRAVRFFSSIEDPLQRVFWEWATGDESLRETLIIAQREACPGAPLVLPADGFIGLLYDDPRGPYSQLRPHQGIDIFSNTDAGETPVYAAHDGYLTRESDWKSSLIIRIPDDPLQPGRQIWLYYTHMADEAGNDFINEAFPPGTQEKFVRQGTKIGYTGNYNGRSARRIWVHLHFSIVRDDGSGHYRNELEFSNTIDPSPYLSMSVNYSEGVAVVGCDDPTSSITRQSAEILPDPASR